MKTGIGISQKRNTKDWVRVGAGTKFREAFRNRRPFFFYVLFVVVHLRNPAV